jgi:hypothetical protein
MDSYTIVSTKDGSNNIIPLTYTLSSNLISFNIKGLTGSVTAGQTGAAEFDILTIPVVTQTTSNSTSVTLNQPYGYILLYSPINFTSSYISFNLINSIINSNSIILNSLDSKIAGGVYHPITCNIAYVSDGNALVSVFNNTGTTTPYQTNITDPIYIYFRIYTENTPMINV